MFDLFIICSQYSSKFWPRFFLWYYVGQENYENLKLEVFCSGIFTKKHIELQFHT
jgi:hypothetical protein